MRKAGWYCFLYCATFVVAFLIVFEGASCFRNATTKNTATKTVVVKSQTAAKPTDVRPTPDERTGIQMQKQIMDEILALIAKEALDRPENLAACVEEMMAMRPNGKCRDKFTYYSNPEKAKRAEDDMRGEFAGVGLTVSQKDGPVVVVALYPGPAERAGIKPGDVIVKVNDKKISDADDIVSLVRGKIGTKVKLTILRGKPEKELEFTLTREKIVIQSVKWSVSPADPKIGIVKISTFDDQAPENLHLALGELIRQRRVTGIILDFRDNPGGSASSATSIAGSFMEDGDKIITYRRRDGEQGMAGLSQLSARIYSLSYRNLAPFGTVKVVILINKNSASASELVAGTLKDWGYTVIGETSYGKGVGQSLFRLSDGSRFALTTFEFLVGNNKVAIRDKGVTPDVVVKQGEDTKKDLQLEKATEILRACVKQNRPSKKCEPIAK